MRFSVLIVTYRRPGRLRETLESVAACNPPADEVLVIDGDPKLSAEAPTRELAARGIVVRYLASSPSLSIQRNRGMEVASGEVFVFLDDDVRVDEHLFGVLSEVYADSSVVGATGPVLEQNPRHFGRPDSPIRRRIFPGGEEGTMTAFGYPRRILDPSRACNVEWMPGCFTSARSEQARLLGFDENVTAEIEGEDEDFSYRLSRRGKIRFEPRAAIDHKQLGFRAKAGSRRFDRNIVIVRTYLFRKNFRQTPMTRAQFAGLIAVLLVHRLVNREWRGALGLLDGVAYVLRHRRRPLLSPERTRRVIEDLRRAPGGASQA